MMQIILKVMREGSIRCWGIGGGKFTAPVLSTCGNTGIAES
jgi:hypothetical protein